MAVDKFEKMKNAQLTRAQKEIDAIFKVAAQEAAAIAGTVRNPNPDKLFSFKDYPQTHDRIKKLEVWMAEELERTISNNITEEWDIAERSGESLTTDFLRQTYEDVSKAPAALQARYFRNNTEAHDAFLVRTLKGMGLSDRVWRLTAQCRQEMELAIDIGLGDGLSAQEISRSIRKYLKEPDRLFRRVRDKHGNLVLSKAAKAYHPGQGVYRSSYKNALRLSATEGNIAYRTADHLKWQQLDFVVGIQIGLSNNHTLNGVPFHDICDELAGRYPKDFKFTGWHPFCRCIATTILMTPEEFKANEEAFLAGKEPVVRSKNEVEDVPRQFKKWRKENAKKIKSAKSLPYFVRDNEQYFNPTRITKRAAKGVKESQALNKALQQVTDPAILREQARQAVLAAAKVRHANRTPEQIADIQRRWDERAEKRRRAAILERAKLRHEARTPRRIADIRHEWFERKAIRHYGNNILSYMGGISDVDTSALAKALKGGDVKLVLAEARRMKATGKEILGLTYLDNPMQVARTFSMADARIVNETVEKNIKEWQSLSLTKQKEKLEFEISYVANPSKYKKGAKQYPTWQVAQNAYKKQLANVVDAIEWEGINKQVADLVSYKTKSKPYLNVLADLNQAVATKNKAEAQSLTTTLANYRTKLEKAAMARQSKKMGNILPDMSKEEIDRLLNIFDTETMEEADNRLRALAEQTWAKLTDEERLILTKYTQTYSYLNEPLRGIPYYGSLTPNADHIHDLPILTSVLEKFKMPQNTVVRRGVNDFAIKELGYNLSNVKVGDVFVDKGFLSTAVHRKKGFFQRYNLVICVPKGANGFYAEPLSHFTDNYKFNYQTKTLWDGKSVEKIGHEAEWIGQRGSEFKVLKKEGNTIYLQMIGQLK